jgi:hypothetical protein
MPPARPLGAPDPVALTSLRADRRVVQPSAALGEGTEGSGSADFGGFGADPGVEVLASEPVAVALEREDL